MLQANKKRSGKIDYSTELSGSTVHVLSGVKFEYDSSAKASDSFLALQFRPAEPLINYHCDFILSKVLSHSPDFKYDLEGSDTSNVKRFMLISSKLWSTKQEAFEIAHSCYQHGAHGVIISLLRKRNTWTTTSLLHDPGEGMITAIAKEWSRSTFSQLESLNIPVLGLLPTAIDYLKESRDKLARFTIQVASLTLIVRDGKDCIVDDLIGSGPLNNSKLTDTQNLLKCNTYSSYNFSSDGPLCYRRLEELMSIDSFPIGMEMAVEIDRKFNNSEDKELSNYVWTQYLETGKWSAKSVENARNYAPMFRERLRNNLEKFSKGSYIESFLQSAEKFLQANFTKYIKNLEPCIFFLVFLYETGDIDSNDFNMKWDGIIKLYIEKGSHKKEEVIERFYDIFNCLKSHHSAIPATFAFYEVVYTINDVDLSKSYLRIFRYFGSKPTLTEESLLKSFVEKISKKCKSFDNLIKLFDGIEQLDSTLFQTYFLSLLDSQFSNILRNFRVDLVKAWFGAPYYGKYKLPTRQQDIQNLLRSLNPTVDTPDVYFELMWLVEGPPYMVPIDGILAEKLNFLCHQGGLLALFKLLLGVVEFPIFISHFDEIEMYLKSIAMEPNYELFQSFAEHLARICRPVDNYQKQVIDRFIPLIFRGLTYTSNRSLFLESMVREQLSEFCQCSYFIDECLTYWLRTFDDAKIFESHRSLAKHIRVIADATKNDPSRCIFVNVISFSNNLLSKNHLATSANLWNQLKAAFEILCRELDGITVDLVYELCKDISVILAIESAFHFSAPLPRLNILEVKSNVDVWNIEIENGIRFIRTMRLYFEKIMRDNFYEVISRADNCNNRSILPVAEIRLILAELSKFSSFFSDSSRRFFLHFATGTKKSELFEVFINQPVVNQRADLVLVALAGHLENIERRLQKLCTTTLTTTEELLHLSQHLDHKDRKPSLEIKLLNDYFSKGTESDHTSRIIKVHEAAMDLFWSREILIDFIFGSNSEPSVLERLQCNFEESDQHYQELRNCVDKLRNEHLLLNLTSEECEVILNSIFFCFGIEVADNKIDNLRGCIQLFSNLAKADKIWKFFVDRPKFVSDEQSFNEKLEKLTSELNREENQLVDIFRRAAFWVRLVQSSIGKPLSAVVPAIIKSDLFKREISHSSKFHELDESQSCMEYVTDLFQHGCTGFGSALVQCKCLLIKSSVVFDLLLHQLTIRYFDAKRNYDVLLSSDQVIEFEQRLEFIQNEENFLDLDISGFLKQLAIYRRGMTVACELFEYGHPQWTSKDFSCPTQSAVLVAAWVDELQATLDIWKEKIEDARRNDSTLFLFTIKQARRVASLIVDGSIHALFNSVAHLFVQKLSDRHIVLSSLEKAVTHQRTKLKTEFDWLSTVQILFGELYYSGVILVQTPSMKEETNIRYNTTSTDQLIIKKVLCYIFGSRSPTSFQILWCSVQLHKKDVLKFLQTAKSFPSLRFAVVQCNLLNQSAQNSILQSILHDKNLQNLHFVECGPSVLQSASWIPVVEAKDVCVEVNLNACYEKWYSNAADTLNRDNDNRLCFVGSSGSGKSHQIRKLMKESAKSLIVSITEEFDWNEILPRMSEGLSGKPYDSILLVFQVNIGKLRENAVERWTALMSKIDDLIFQLLILRSVVVLDSEYIVNLPWGSNCTIALELPNRAEHLEGINGPEYELPLEEELPTIHAIFKVVNASQCSFDIDKESKQVCRYLKAYDTEIIDTLCEPDIADTDIVFVLDCSGSMHANDRLNICKDRLMSIMHSKLQPKFRVGLVLFNHDIKVVPLKPLDFNRDTLAIAIREAQAYGGSNMWTALKRALEMLSSTGTPTKRILVALTDGEAYSNKAVAESVNASLSNSHCDVQVIFITVKLDTKDRNEIEKRCIRKLPRDKLIEATDGDSLVEAWVEIGEILTVSQIIEREAKSITDEECNRLLDKYMHKEHRNALSKFQQVFWIRYMYRRCKILASSETFNTNCDKPNFGKTTMEIMLKEVERVLSNNHQVDWNSIRHEHMVFRKEIVTVGDEDRENYSWSILCSNPNDLDAEWIERKEKLSSHGIQVPTIEDMERPDRRVLDSYLAYGIGVDLEATRAENSSSGKPFDFELGSLYLLDTVLTLDFTIKLLTINERIECGIPCIMQGETGVSKTELVRMLFTLKNGSMRESDLFSLSKINLRHMVRPSSALKLIVIQIIIKCWDLDRREVVRRAWHNCDELIEAILHSCDAVKLQELIFDEFKANPVFDPLEHFSDPSEFLNVENSAKLLLWFVDAVLKHSVHDIHWTFYSVNVHAAMKMKEIERIVIQVSQRAERIIQLGEYLDSPAHRNTKMCIFFDEFNTSSHMGVLKEVITNRTINGVAIASNVVIVAACNPARKKVNFFSDRKQEHGIEWVSGHYQTHPLPQSIQAIVWDYGSLLPNQEEEFIKKRLELAADTNAKSSEEIRELTNLIYEAHKITRELAKKHLESLVRNSDVNIPPNEIDARASSALSLRDILRCFKLFQYLSSAPAIIVRRVFIGDDSTDKDIWLLAIGIVYYLRLGVDATDLEGNYRRQFMTQFSAKFGNDADLHCRTKVAMKNLMDQTELPGGIAPTDGLQENIYVVFVCLMAKVPVMVVGPPGSSKTLAISVLVDNARGKYSKTEVYKNVSTLIPLHYQCSRRSTSTQIEEVFERAIDRQAIADKQAKAAGKVTKAVYFVFMDEAGLPEEGRDSLKVLHYYLANHMNARAEVGFVAISNHVLDAAKTNRCTLLMRNLPVKAELLEFTKGYSQQQLTWTSFTCYVSHVEIGGKVRQLNVSTDIESKDNLFKYLCLALDECISKVKGFLDFFGLRDYMNFMSLLGRLAQKNNNITLEIIHTALERNFNGSSKSVTEDIIKHFIDRFHSTEVSKRRLTNPIGLLEASLSEQFQSTEPTGRYVMLIDTTTCDGVLHFFVKHVVGRVRKLPKLLQLSDFPEDSQKQQMNLISQARFAMERGDFVVLSHCEAINESFYDLFNHHFSKFLDKHEGKVIYHTNIAVGGDSRRCNVHPQFQCLMHLTIAELNIAPAPFLNRFEKYRITMVDALEFILSNHPCRSDFPLATVVEKVLIHLRHLFGLVGYESFLGYADDQTVESVVILILLKLNSVRAIPNYVQEEILSTSNSLSKADRDELKNALVSNCLVRDYFQFPIYERIRDVGVTLLAQAMLSEAVKYFIGISLPECLLAKSAYLPSSLIDMVVTKEKFKLDFSSKNTKRIIYTRTTNALVQMQALQHDHQANLFVLSACKNESLLTEALELFLKSDASIDRMVIVIDLCSTPSSMINFVRNKLESIDSPEKGFTMLIHGTNVDIRSHCIYDVVFDQIWEQKFIDSFCDTCDLSWLQIAYTLDIFDTALVSQILYKRCEAFIPLALGVISDRLYICREAGSALKFNETLNVFLGEKLLNLYCNFWLNTKFKRDDSNTGLETPLSYALLRDEIQSIVQKYAANAFNMSLLQFVSDEMDSMFTRFIFYFIEAVFEDISVIDFMTLDDRLMNLLIEGLDCLPQPDLGLLEAPIHYDKIQPSQEKSFPFFRRLHRYMQDKVGEVVDVHCTPGETSDDIWNDLVTDFSENYIGSNPGFANLYRIVENSSSAWEFYLEKFVSEMFPSAISLQSRFIIFWLKRQVRLKSKKVLSSSNIALLYITFAINNSLLHSFFDCLGQFQFSTMEESIQRYLNGFSDDEKIDSSSTIITQGFILICYEAMLGCNSCDDYLSWTQSVSALLLKPLGQLRNCDDRQLRKMAAVMTVSSLMTEKRWNISNVSAFRDKLRSDDSGLPFSKIVSHFQTYLSTDIDFDFLTLLLIRNTSTRLSMEEREWIMDYIMVDTIMASPIQLAPLLDILLFGITNETAVMSSSFPTSMLDWVKSVDNAALLFSRVESNIDIDGDYIPDFLREPGDTPQFPLLVDVAFHIIWKWIHTFFASNTSIIEIDSLKKNLYKREKRDVEKRIINAAFDLFIIKRWVETILNRDGFCTKTQEIVADIVRNCKPQKYWISYTYRLFLELYVHGDFDSLCEYIEQWRIEHCSQNKILQSWLMLSCKTHGSVNFEGLSFQSYMNISRSSNAKEDPIIPAAVWNIQHCDQNNRTSKKRLECGGEIQNDLKSDDLSAAEDPIRLVGSLPAISFICGLDRLTCIWVLPCLWKFYQWLTDVMMNYNVAAEDVRPLSIGQIMERYREEHDPAYYSCLWVKLKVGIRQYITRSGKFKDFGKDIEETSVWKLLSVCDHNGTHNGILIDIMVAILNDCKHALFGTDGTSETISLKLQHLISIEKLEVFFPTLIEDNESDNFEQYFEEKLTGCSRVWSYFGIWQRLVWVAETRQNPLLLNLEIQRVRSSIPELRHLRIKPQICSFSGTSHDLQSFSESIFDPIFHSLEKFEIHSLLRSLRYYEFTEISDSSDSFQTILETIRGKNSFDLPKILGISESSQLAFIASLQFKEVPKLIGYLEGLLQSEKFLFSNKPLELKSSWPASKDKRLEDIRIRRTDLHFYEEARRLETLLIEREIELSHNFKISLVSAIERFFKSENDLLMQYPLLQEILDVFSFDKSCILVCGHYVFLRLKLRFWMNSLKKKAPDRTWDWSIKSYHANALEETFEPNKNRWKLPWFIHEAVLNEVFQPNASRPDDDITGSMIGSLPDDSHSHGSTTDQKKKKPSSMTGFFGKNNEYQNLLKKLEFELKNPRQKLSFVNKLKSIVGDKLFLASEKQQNNLYRGAIEHIRCYWAEVDECRKILAALLAEKPFNRVDVQAVCNKLKELEATDDGHYKTACSYLERFENLLSQQCDILNWKTSPLSVMRKLEEEATFFGVELNPELLQLKRVLEKDIQILQQGMTAWALLNTEVIKTLMRACDHFPNIEDPFLLKSTTTNEQRALIDSNGYIDKIKTCEDDGTLVELFEKLRKDVQDNPLYSWVHSKALVAAVAVMPKVHRYKTWDYLKGYLETVIQQPIREVANIIMLVLARIDPNCDQRFRKACLRKVYSAKTAVLMTEVEIELLQPPFEEVDATLINKPIAIDFPSIGKLMDMVGLDKVKAELKMIEENSLGPGCGVTQSHHFILFGNPGTGKTSVAKIIRDFLTEAGIRSSFPLIELAGEAIMRMGYDKFAAVIGKAQNGVIFIDDAHTLSSTSTPDGEAIIELILNFAESKRHDASIILAGNKDGIEDNLLNFHSGFASRFPHILFFDDYTDEELGSIFRQMCGIRQWSCANENVVRAAARRISRDRGRITFCNARSVRDFFEKTYHSTLCSRRNHSQTFILADVLGPKPDPKSNFELKVALGELNAMIGLKFVKNEIDHLIDLVSANYDRLLRGEISQPVILNRVFLGNPGTGKTTVAKLYGRILKALGLLSDGGIERQNSKDLIGAPMGKIAALLEQCVGKVLIIDEAIDLCESPFCSEAMNAMVGMLHNTVAEDIAIVLIGSEMQMCEKLKVIKEGLAWRFWFDRPFAFDDYTDDELEQIAADFAANNDLRINFPAGGALIRSVSSQRCLSKFGNARTIINLVNNAMISLTSRDPSSKVLTLEDFGLSVNQPDVRPVLLEACMEAGYDSSHDKRKELMMILAQVESGGLFTADIMSLLESKCGTSVHSTMPLLRVHSLTILKGMKNAVTAEEIRLQERKRLLQRGREDECQQLDLDRRQHLDILNSNRFCKAGFSWHRNGNGWLCAGGTCSVLDDQVEHLIL